MTDGATTAGDGAGGADRLDRVLVARGLVPSRAQARALVREGAVEVDGRPVARPGARVGPEAAVRLTKAPHGHVGRGALKLIAALDAFGLDPAGRVAVDLGASTGGFTEVLLERGAARVHAVDVGHGQLAARLAADPRVVRRDGLNARDVSPADLGEAPDVVVADVSFISLSLALPPALALAAPDAFLVALVKPQFEVGRAAIGKNGIVRDAAAAAAAVERIAALVDGTAGWRTLGTLPSPIAGGDGNRETLLAARKDRP